MNTEIRFPQTEEEMRLFSASLHRRIADEIEHSVRLKQEVRRLQSIKELREEQEKYLRGEITDEDLEREAREEGCFDD